jgi:hypothetical protein
VSGSLDLDVDDLPNIPITCSPSARGDGADVDRDPLAVRPTTTTCCRSARRLPEMFARRSPGAARLLG